MQIYKLQYKDKETALSDLIAKGVYNEDLSFGQGIHAIVEIGLIVDKEATFDEDGNIITEPIYFYGYHYDIMSENIITFESEIQVNNPKHNFAGYVNPLLETELSYES